jgi:hypothetical protein
MLNYWKLQRSARVLPRVTTTSNKFSTATQQYNKHIYAMQECQVAKHFKRKKLNVHHKEMNNKYM